MYITLIGQAAAKAVTDIVSEVDIHINPTHVANCLRTELCSQWEEFEANLTDAISISDEMGKAVIQSFISRSALNALRRAGYSIQKGGTR